jgi:spore coat protein H
MTWGERGCIYAAIILLAACGDTEGGAGDDAGRRSDAGARDAGPTPDASNLRCDPTGPVTWVLEGEMARVPVTCRTGMVLSPDSFSLPSGPPGLTLAGAELTWTPGLDQGGVYDVPVEALGERGGVRIGVVDRWDHADNVLVDPETYTEEYGLPVLHVFPSVDPTREYTAATVVYRGHTYVAEIKIRGASSFYYPKQNYNLKFSSVDPFDEPVFPVWDGGFRAKRKIALTSPFDDNSYVRQRLAYETWNRIDPAHLPIQAYNAVVFYDGVYHGLYAITDRPDDEYLGALGLSEDANLYMAVSHDANFRLQAANGGTKGSLSAGYEKKEGLPAEGSPGAFTDLEDLVRFVIEADDTTFRDGIFTRVEQRDYEDWWIFVSLIEGDDSAGKNSFHYHDPAISASRWRYMPWDFNHSFGQTWQTARQGYDSDPDGYVWANEMFARFLREPAISVPLRARYRAVMDGVVTEAAMQDLVEALLAEVWDGALRDEGKWGAQYRSYSGWSWRDDFIPFVEEADYLRAWITSRYGYLDGLF